MAEGLNISTGLGEGAAQVFHFENLHNTVNNLIQQDIKKKQDLRSQYEKSSLIAAQAMQGLRPADVGLFREHYDNYKKADLMLMNPKVQNNTKEFQYWTDQKMSAYSDMLQTQAESKKAASQMQSLVEQNTKDGGINAKPDFDKQVNEYNQLPYNEIIKQGRYLPTNYFFDKGRMTEDVFNERLRGTEKKQDVLIPDKSGKTQTFEYTHPSVVTLQTENGKPVMSDVTGKVKLNYSPLVNEYTQGLKQIGGRAIHELQTDFLNQNPQEVKETFTKANQYLQDAHQQAIPQTPEYYKLAQRIVQTTNETSSNLKKETEPFSQKLAEQRELAQMRSDINLNKALTLLADRQSQSDNNAQVLAQDDLSSIKWDGKKGFAEIPISKVGEDRYKVKGKVPVMKNGIVTGQMKEQYVTPDNAKIYPYKDQVKLIFYKYDEDGNKTNEEDTKLTKFVPLDDFMRKNHVDDLTKKDAVKLGSEIAQTIKQKLIGNQPKEEPVKKDISSQYPQETINKIDAFMKVNKIKTMEEAIDILKKAGKLK